MTTSLVLQFDGQKQPFSDQIVHRAQICAGLGELFEIVLIVHSTDPAVDPHSVVGSAAELLLDGEPQVDRMKGLVRSVRQLTSVRSATGATASYYEVVIVPPLFLAGLREGRRIHQDKNVFDILKETIAPYLATMPAPVTRTGGEHPPRDYCVQFDETDLRFIQRILSEEHLAMFFDAKKSSGLTIVDDCASLTDALPFRLSYRLPSNLDPVGPAAVAVRLEDGYASGAADLRDYDFTRPLMSRAVPPTLSGNATMQGGDKPFANEASLSIEQYEVGRFTQESSGDTLAKGDLLAARRDARTIECETNVAILPGTRFYIDDHPRPELADELLVVSCRILLDDGVGLPLGLGSQSAGVVNGPPRRSVSLKCVRAAGGYAPRRLPKPRAVGPETAFIVGSSEEGQIDVDEHGRVEVEFVWDRRDLRSGKPTRRVRVSQGWAGTNRGFVTLPRIGDEVLIGYDGGDPDQPIVTGRVHNAVARTPLNLPNPDATVSVWKSRTVGGEGYNQVLMDDKPSDERLELRAEKTRTDLTQGNESSTVGGSFTEDIGGQAKIHVHAETQVKLDSDLDAEAGVTVATLESLLLTVNESAIAIANAGWLIQGPNITILAGDTSITMGDGTIKVKAPTISLEGDMVKIKGNVQVDIDGTLITLN